MKKFNYFLFLFSAFSHLVFSQHKNERTFSEIRKPYEKMTIDDIKAMPLVNLYIQKAKKEKDYGKLLQGYRDGRQFDNRNKIKYADSALTISLEHGTKQDISKEYLSKGIIYYFYQKKYKLALQEYIKAFEYSKESEDHYHHYKVMYHLGIVKAHLGYYDEALEHFNKCLAFYSKMNSEQHENENFNYKKGYFNSLHQIAVVNIHLKNFTTSDSLSHLGYRLTENDDDFQLEKSYFLKCIGISKFYRKDFTSAIKTLKNALPAIQIRNDFAWASVVYYYLGQTYEAQNDSGNTVKYYVQIDSIFNKHDFIVPEVYKGYQYLINHYKNRDVKKQLYYTNQLHRADSLIRMDYPYLSAKVHKDYDRKILIEEKNEIESSSRKQIITAQILIFFAVIALIFFMIRYHKDQIIKRQYIFLQKKIAEGNYNVNGAQESETSQNSIRKTSLTEEMTLEIKTKLQKFELEEQYRKKGLTQKIIAERLGTNSHYLSIFINEQKGINFNRYMAELRIKYITHLLNTNTKYLNYTIEALAEECGIAARQNFSNLFYDINGIRPTDYIKNRKKELGHND